MGISNIKDEKGEPKSQTSVATWFPVRGAKLAVGSQPGARNLLRHGSISKRSISFGFKETSSKSFFRPCKGAVGNEIGECAVDV